MGQLWAVGPYHSIIGASPLKKPHVAYLACFFIFHSRPESCCSPSFAISINHSFIHSSITITYKEEQSKPKTISTFNFLTKIRAFLNFLFGEVISMATFSERSDSGVEEEAINRVIRSIDLVAAARRQVGFLKRVYEAQWLHHPPTLLHAIRRYDELWMPLISDLTVGSIPPMVLPPLDVQWVWFCHTLNPGSYRLYCESRFSKLLEKPAVFDDLNEEYALNTCIEIWSSRYPSEPFELEPIAVGDNSTIIVADESINSEVSKHKSLYSKFSDPYVSEIVYLIAAKLRYQRFLYLLHKTKDGYSKLVPTVDIHLMWITHQSYPVVYAEDMKEMERDLRKVVGVWDTVEHEDIEATKKLWDEAFEQPLEKAGGSTIIELMMKKKPLFYWEDWNADVNSKYKSMEPRFLLEVCVFVRGNRETKETKRDFLRFKTVRCHREIKMDKPISSVPCNTWRKMWHMYCEFGTRGVVLELRQRGGGTLPLICSKEKKSSKLKTRVPFVWNELLRAQCLTLERELGQNWRLVASITPPTQAPYLLKCVPDRVTDDSGAMVSDLILKMNRYRPQEGRWLSRTVLDHGGRECFVLRIRVGSGFWRRGGEVPVGVKLEDRIIEVREGSWKYVAGPIGRAPDKVVGTATPKASEGCWSLLTGYELTVQWESSSGLGFNLQNETSPDSVRLLKGRKMQYQVNDMASKSKEEQEKEEDEFVTLVRYTPENPKGRATALMNWRMLVVELLPEEDAVLVLLLCMSILRSVSEMRREDVGGLLIRRRLQESAIGLRDWGSVLLHPSMSDSSTSLFSSPHLQPWYWDAKAVMASVEADHYKTTDFRYSPTEGDDKLYKRGIIP